MQNFLRIKGSQAFTERSQLVTRHRIPLLLRHIAAVCYERHAMLHSECFQRMGCETCWPKQETYDTEECGRSNLLVLQLAHSI